MAKKPKKVNYQQRIVNLLTEIRDLLKSGKEVKPADTRFELQTSFTITVPKGYRHDTRLRDFRSKHYQEFYYYNGDITDSNFANVSTKLAPGKQLTVKVFGIKELVSSEDCLTFLKGQGSLLVGAQGLSLVYEQAKDKLPKGRYHVSFDEKDALWVDSGGRLRVPYISARTRVAPSTSAWASFGATGIPAFASCASATPNSALVLRFEKIT